MLSRNEENMLAVKKWEIIDVFCQKWEKYWRTLSRDKENIDVRNQGKRKILTYAVKKRGKYWCTLSRKQVILMYFLKKRGKYKRMMSRKVENINICSKIMRKILYAVKKQENINVDYRIKRKYWHAGKSNANIDIHFQEIGNSYSVKEEHWHTQSK